MMFRISFLCPTMLIREIQKPVLEIAKSLNGLLFPKVCAACENRLVYAEKFICLDCLATLPKTSFHAEPDNAIERIFYGRTAIHAATSLYHFNKSSRVQRMIWYLKYHRWESLGVYLGNLLGEEIIDAARFADIDIILSVPLHPRRKKERGFNQSAAFAQGISEVLNTSFSDDLISRTEYSETQTRKSKTERWDNVSGIFRVNDSQALEGKHILLVDDVITTGTTLESCAETILNVSGTSISLATIGTALHL